MAGLTPKQQRFVEEYLVDFNATAAYKRAGYKARTNVVARVEACRLLAKPSIAAAIQAAQAQRAQKAELSADRVLREYLQLAFNDLRDIFEVTDAGVRLKPLDQWPEGVGRSLASIKVRRELEKKTAKPGETAKDEGFTEIEVIEFKLWSKVEALEKLGKHLGLFKDQLDVNLKGPALKVYMGFDPNEVVCPSPSPSPPETTSPSSDGPTNPAGPPSA